MTKRTMFELLTAMVEVSDNPQKEDLLKGLANEIKLLDNKKARGGRSDKMIATNKAITDLLIKELTNIGTPVTITDLMNSSEAISNYTYTDGKEEKSLTNSKITAMLSPLVRSEENPEGIVKRETLKKKSYYSVI